MTNQYPAVLGPLLSALTGSKVVDLTVTLAENLPAAWPRHMPFQRKIFNWYADQPDLIPPHHSIRGSYHTAWLVLDEHCGTHIDAPVHVIPPPGSGPPNASDIGNITLERLNLSKGSQSDFRGRARTSVQGGARDAEMMSRLHVFGR